MSVAKLPPVEGEDGRIYFNYNLGAKWRNTRSKKAGNVFEVIDCYYDSETETEFYDVTKNGVLAWEHMSAEKIKFLLSFEVLEQIEEGEPQELPLLNSEVSLYYAQQFDRKNKAKKEANKQLKDTRYFDFAKKIKELKESRNLAEATGDVQKLAEIDKQIAELTAKQLAILKEKKIDQAVLVIEAACAECKDTGFTDGIAERKKICTCAIGQTEVIKAYAAAVRRSKK